MELIKDAQNRDWNAKIRTVNPQGQGMTRFLNPPKSVGSSPYFVLDLSLANAKIGENFNKVVATVFVDTVVADRNPIAALFADDIEAGEAGGIVNNETGIVNQIVSGKHVFLEYGMPIRVNFTVKGVATSNVRLGEKQFVFGGDTLIEAQQRLIRRVKRSIAAGDKAYELVIGEEEDDAFAAALREYSLGQ